MHIDIREYLQEKPNGDRATTLTMCSRWDVVLVINELNEAILNDFNCYDNFQVYINPRSKIWPEVRAYANMIADALGVDTHTQVFKEEETVSKQWVSQGPIPEK